MLKIQSLSASHGKQPVLRDLDLVMTAGECASLLGPSGAGKSTLLRCVAGLHRPDAGTIVVDDQTVWSSQCDVAPVNRRVAMVFQSYALWPHLTVAKQVALVAPRGTDANHWIDRLGLGELRQRVPGQLSGGEQARLALARALAGQPKVLLLDEPFRHLDPGLASDLRTEVFGWFRKQSITALLVTHDQNEAFQFSDTVHVLGERTIQASGSPRSLENKPPSAQVARFLGRRTALVGRSTGPGRLETCLGVIEVSPETRGTTLWLRPEDLTVGPSDPGNGRVEEVRFEGPTTLLRVRVSDQLFSARVTGDPPFTVGDPVQVQLRTTPPTFADEEPSGATRP